MRLSAIALALMLVATSASANITTFGTKNNTYTPPTPNADTVPEPLRDKFSVCPSIHDPLPIKLLSQNVGAYVNVNFALAKLEDTTNLTLRPNRIVQNLNYSKSDLHYPTYDTNHNYVPHVNGEFKQYILKGNGVTPPWQRTFYYNLVGRNNRKNLVPIYLTPTYRMESKDFSREILLPTRDFDVFDIIISNQRHSPWDNPSHQRFNDFFIQQNYGSFEARITFYKKTGDDKKIYYKVYEKNPGSIHFEWGVSQLIDKNGGSFDIRSVRDIQIGFDTANKQTRLAVMINRYGDSRLNLSEYDPYRSWFTDPNITYEMYKGEEDFIRANKCFY
ncbi:hypothetical protein RZ186_000161 [Vibrio cholerae]|nr:hypothetical protein [Vibrio cholerae]ELA3029805.1 hypothetical protein [Vibrio cholerae]ELN7715003.1 hypothetical protein [Vibrio cholerae]